MPSPWGSYVSYLTRPPVVREGDKPWSSMGLSFGSRTTPSREIAPTPVVKRVVSYSRGRLLDPGFKASAVDGTIIAATSARGCVVMPCVTFPLVVGGRASLCLLGERGEGCRNPPSPPSSN